MFGQSNSSFKAFAYLTTFSQSDQRSLWGQGRECLFPNNHIASLENGTEES